MIKRKGSALLITLSITTFLGILLLGFWHKIAIFNEIVQQRTKFYKNFYLAEICLDSALLYAKNNYKKLMSKNANLPIITHYELPETVNKTYGNFKLKYVINRAVFNKKKEKKLWIKTVLTKKNKIELTLSCKLEKQESELENDITEKNKFFVQNFSIGNFF